MPTYEEAEPVAVLGRTPEEVPYRTVLVVVAVAVYPDGTRSIAVGKRGAHDKTQVSESDRSYGLSTTYT